METSEMTANELLEKLLSACSAGYAACRAVTHLVPVGGEFDKILPPTYAGGRYATEKRRWNGEQVDVVLLDSVQSQANRLELALLGAVTRNEIRLPVVKVAFENGTVVTSLDAPHRIADAIFRDCDRKGKPFRESDVGREIFAARAENATGLFKYAPTALLFGVWDSTDLLKRAGARFARALVSEVVGVGSLDGKRTASRIDPLGIRRSQRTMYLTDDGRWTFDETRAVKRLDRQGNPIPQKVGKEGKPSEANLGNVTPSITHDGRDRQGNTTIEIHGGVTVRNAVQTTVLSFAQLRQLRFPDPDKKHTGPDRDAAGRAVLAALGIYAVGLLWEQGYQLRSRCQLVPKKEPCWEFLETTAAEDLKRCGISVAVAKEALSHCLERAKKCGLEWQDGEPIELQPGAELAQLVRENEEFAGAEEEPER